jgi:hypothetical protein
MKKPFRLPEFSLDTRRSDWEKLKLEKLVAAGGTKMQHTTIQCISLMGIRRRKNQSLDESDLKLIKYIYIYIYTFNLLNFTG